MNMFKIFRDNGTPGSGAGAPPAAAAGTPPAAAAGTPPAAAAGTPPPPGPAAGTNPPATPTSWTEGLTPDLSGYVGTKGWKDPASVVDSYRNLEKFHGVPLEQLAKIPADGNPEEMGKIYDRLGRPAKPEEYKIPGPNPTTAADPKFAGWAQKAFHETGLSAGQAEKLATQFNTFQQAQFAEANTAYQTKADGEVAALKTEWGQAYEHNRAVGENAAKTFGVTTEQFSAMEKAMGVAGTVKFFNNIGKGLGEDKFVTSGGSGNGNGLRPMSPEAATNRLSALKADKAWGAKYLARDVQAVAEAEHLMRMSNPSV